VQQIFKVKVRRTFALRISTARCAAGPERRLTARLKKAYVKLADGEKMIEYADNL